MLDLEWIQQRILDHAYLYSRHGDRERQKDSLRLDEVEQAVLASRVLEQYDDTGRGKSCLLAGFTHEGKPVHVVCGQLGDRMVIITVYVPSPPKYKTPFERSN